MDKGILALLFFTVLKLPLIFERIEYIDMTGDAGVYSIAAMHLSTEGKFTGKLEVWRNLNNELKEEYEKSNLHQYDPDQNKGIYMPGTYIERSEYKDYYFQFYPSWPIVLSLWGSIFGTMNQSYVMVLLYIITIFLFYFTLIRWRIRGNYALLASILLGSSPLLVYFCQRRNSFDPPAPE